MGDFYTHVSIQSGKILYRGVENGRRFNKRVGYGPSLFIPSKTPSKYKTLQNKNVGEVEFCSISEAREFINSHEGVQNSTIYGNRRFEYPFISDKFPSAIEWNKDHIHICNIDIEVGSENGFPSPDTASETITAITYKIGKKFMVFGCGVFRNDRTDVQYIHCQDEIDLIQKFMDEWIKDYPDIITGWNVKFFDVPYLINRMTNLFGEIFARRFSPWGRMSERKVFIMGRDQIAKTPSGISVLDYMELYRKYAPQGNSRESYKLDAICAVEINERKLSYEEYGTLHTLYKNDYQKFIEYNIRDVELVERLDNKLKLIELALNLAYDSKCNYEDVFTQVRMWDTLTYNRLKTMNIVVPPNVKGDKSDSYIGGYVKEPQIGLHKWVVSFDLDSLYPHLIMQFNISPDTFVEPVTYTTQMRSFLSTNKIDIQSLLNKEVDTSTLKDIGVTLTPNGQLFHIDRRGFLAEMMNEMYDDRKKYKKKAIEAKKELEHETDPIKRTEIENRIARFNILQLAKKVCLNSAYGALGSEYFRFFDIRQASAITTAGQLAIQWIGLRLNEYLNKLLKTNNRDYIIASDTDSVYLCFDELVCQSFGKENQDTAKVIKFLDKVSETKIQPFIDKSYNDLAEYLNSLEQKMHMKREALADKGIWTAKKRYILNVHNSEGVQYAKPEIKVSGLEMIKSSTPSACRVKLKESLNIIVNGTNEEMIKFIVDFREEFKTLPLAEIAFPRGVNGISDYTDIKTGLHSKGTPIHVRGCIIYNNLLKQKKLTKKYPELKEGDKIKFIYLREPNIIRSNIISFSDVLPNEFDLEGMIDYSTQFEKSFLEPLKIILDCIGWHTEKRNSLLGFFS